jgi:hypothetical protein
MSPPIVTRAIDRLSSSAACSMRRANSGVNAAHRSGTKQVLTTVSQASALSASRTTTVSPLYVVCELTRAAPPAAVRSGIPAEACTKRRSSGPIGCESDVVVDEEDRRRDGILR